MLNKSMTRCEKRIHEKLATIKFPINFIAHGKCSHKPTVSNRYDQMFIRFSQTKFARLKLY